MLYREAFYRGAFSSPFSARLKCNGHFANIPPEYGGHYTILGWCHTFFQLLPPEQYFNEHPDWYSEIDGRRTAQGTQLCLTNVEMRKELIHNALSWISKNPEAGIISINPFIKGEYGNLPFRKRNLEGFKNAVKNHNYRFIRYFFSIQRK